MSLTWRITHTASPSGIHEDPGLHLSHTRMSVFLTPGSRVAIQVVCGKRKACLDEKRSRFN